MKWAEVQSELMKLEVEGTRIYRDVPPGPGNKPVRRAIDEALKYLNKAQVMAGRRARIGGYRT